MTELEAVERLQRFTNYCMTKSHTERWRISSSDQDWAWTQWSCWQSRVGLGYHMPELASIRVLRVYRLFHFLGGRGGADFDVQVGYSGRSERAKVIAEGIGADTCRISLYRWVNGQRRRIGPHVVGVLVHPSDGWPYVENLQTMPATAG